MFEDQNDLLYEFDDDLTPNTLTINDTFGSFLQLGFDEDSQSQPGTPKTPSTPTKETQRTTSTPTGSNSNTVYPLPIQRNTNLHNQSYAPIYYPQMQSQQQNAPQQKNGSTEFMKIPTNLPFWTAAPLPFIPEKFPPQEIVPNHHSLTEKDQKRLHRQEAIKKWMSKRTRRDFNRKVAPQKSQVASNRQRMGGKFISSNTSNSSSPLGNNPSSSSSSSDEETMLMEKEIQRLKKQVEEEEFIAQSLELKLNQTQIELSLLRSHGLVNGMLRSQLYYPTLEPNRQILDPSKDPRQSTIDYNQMRAKLKKTGLF